MDDCVVSSLVCQENETCLQAEDDSSSLLHFNDHDHRVSSVDDEFVHILIDREIALGFGSEKNQSLVFGNWIKLARLDAINWILKVSPTTHFLLLWFYWGFWFSFILFFCGKSKTIESRQDQHSAFAFKQLTCLLLTWIDSSLSDLLM